MNRRKVSLWGYYVRKRDEESPTIEKGTREKSNLAVALIKFPLMIPVQL